MTKEEASNILDDYDVNFDGHTAEEIAEAFEVAFRALEQEPCNDAISRKAVLDTTICEGISCNECSFNEIDGEPGCLLHARIDELPPVNPQPKTGHWIDIMVGDMPAQACDQCNTFYPLAYTGGGHHYCPNCGAKMESEGKK